MKVETFPTMGGCHGKAKDERFLDRYVIGPELGRGHFASVNECYDRHTKEKLAVKIIKKEQLGNIELLESEVAILTKVAEHPHVLRIRKSYSEKAGFYIVTEFCSGGDLFSRIVEEGECSERRASEIMAQLASATHYIHSCG
eukprot:521801_1